MVQGIKDSSRILKKKKSRKKLLTYYRSMEEIRAYQKVPAHQKLRWWQRQMSFFIML